MISDKSNRIRAREMGIIIGEIPTGKTNSISDITGVRVGHSTIIKGEGALVPGKGPIRTGITAILPHTDNVFQEKVPASVYVCNGFGKATGIPQIMELGTLETPIVLTNTLNVGLVWDATVSWMLEKNPEIGIKTGSVNPVVGECFDGFLNDIQGRHVKQSHVFRALKAAEQQTSYDEGAIGAGTGMQLYQL